MIIYPAIDIRNGKCVRLKQGKFEECTYIYDSPVKAAENWVENGARALHIVDLDGALEGRPVNMGLVREIKRNTGAFIEYGGGVRDEPAVELIVETGIDRIIFGTSALKNRPLVKWAAQKYGDKIAVGIDVKDKKAAYNGWTDISDVNMYELTESLIDIGVNTFIYTDISKDGMLNGTDLDGIKSLKERFDINIIASGGITTIDDIKNLKCIGVYGAIIGKALYNGNIKLEDVLEELKC